MEHTNTVPRQVDISLSQGMKIVWSDGHESQYPLGYLRKNCPCATCVVETETPFLPPNPLSLYKPTLRLSRAETVGRYALRLFWSDGHDTGIYAYDHLREICPCSECLKSPSQ